ncbi:lysophospholipid acyltransferase family protein [Paraflavitalea speifideaquila]|uniref:lysophospholipid acyltransferase family protein n=1 Tax=Paraflavitalea speifideaquila TaxID=3076558 RepID=UPI0028EE11F9|nr:1-acyl-sn-glycerol-3-phosphate acyltransferase [Paraflavitalea speifideiaquila]
MKFIKEILGRIFALWAILVFAITLLLFMIPFLLFTYRLTDPKKTFRFIAQSRIWMGIYLPLIGCPLRVRGKENFAPGQNYVVVCNHNSLMDVPISSPAIPGGNKTIAKIEMAQIPVFGIIYQTGSVLVDRKSEKSRKDSFSRMKKY